MPASDIKLKPVKVKLDKERNLKYDFNAFAEIEEKFGTVQKALDELNKQKMRAIRTILWAGLIHEDEKLTERQVGAMFTLGDIGEIVSPLMEAITAALPKADEPKNE